MSFYISLTEAAKRDYFSISFFPFPVYLDCPCHICGALIFFNGSINNVYMSLQKTLTSKRNINFQPQNNPIYFNWNISMNICLKKCSLEGTVPHSPKATRGWLLLFPSKGIKSHWTSDQNIDPSRSHFPMIHGDIN